MRPIRFGVSLAALAILSGLTPGSGETRAATVKHPAAGDQLDDASAQRTIVLALELDRDGARLIGFTVKGRAFVPPREKATPKIYAEGDPAQIEVALIGPGGVRYTRRNSVAGLCLAHGPEAPAELAGDTIRLHRESVLVEEPELAGFDQIEVAYYAGGATVVSRTVLGVATLDAAHYTGAGGKVRYEELAIARASSGARRPASALTPGTVHFPEEFGDPDILTVYGNQSETAKRINIVIVPDGYTYAEKGTMQANAQSLVNAFRARTPYKEHDLFINYVLVYAYSTEDGTDQCDCSIVRDTAMSTRFANSTPVCGDFDNRCLYYGGGCDTDSSTNIAVTELRAPADDKTIVMVNTARYGGCGGERAVYAAGNPNATEVAIHEMGHSLAGLVDEYGGNPVCGAGGGINASMDAVSGNWPEWIPELGAPSEGALFYDHCVYRPAPVCEMRSLGVSFCPVCSQQWALTFFGHARVNPTAPIETVSPGSPVSTDRVTETTFSVATRLASGPGVTNDVTWQLQGPGFPTATTVATGTYEYTRTFAESGTYALTSRVVADTNFIKPVKNGANVDSASWTVRVCDPAAVSSASNNGPICSGGTLQLSAATFAGGTYLWTGPAGFQSTEQNPAIPGASSSAAGTYAVTITTGGCEFSSTTNASVIEDGSACDDGENCTQLDACHAGLCAGTIVVCNDGNPCTSDSCTAAGVCVHPPIPCTAGDACHPAGICDPGTALCSYPLRDADHDGHVDVQCAGDDCNDANAQVWLAPVAATGLRASGPLSTLIVWDDQGAAVGPGTTYDLVSGTLKRAGHLDFTTSDCLRSGPGVSYVDTRPKPPPAWAFWYLVRGRNPCGVGTYGSQLADAVILPCP